MNYRELIDSKGLRHDFVAKNVGVSKTMLSLFLKGERNLSPEYKMRLHRVLKVN